MNLTSPLAQDEGASEGEPLASADALQSGSLPKIVGPHRKTICSLFSKSKTTRMEQDGGKHQNGWIHSCSQRSVEEHLQETTIGDGGTHLVEFSNAMRAVEKALRQVAASKGRAQDEAAEWKRKYEMERLRAASLEQEQQVLEQELEQCRSPPDPWTSDEPLELEKADTENGERSPVGSANGWFPLHVNSDCCKREGICSQQLLRSHSSSSGNISLLSEVQPVAEKASFRLVWGCAGKVSPRHKHDVVSFECGNISTASRSSKQITLVWDSPPQTVLIISKPNSPTCTALCKEMIRWLREEKGVGVYLEPPMKKEILAEDYFNCVKSCETGAHFGAVEECDLSCTLSHTVATALASLNGTLRSAHRVSSD